MSMAIHKDAVFALELMNVVLQQEQQMDVSYGLMIPSSKKEDLKTETTSAVETSLRICRPKLWTTDLPSCQSYCAGLSCSIGFHALLLVIPNLELYVQHVKKYGHLKDGACLQGRYVF
jgi:hypothetical protein